MIADHRSPPSKMNAGKPWSKTDLFFLKVQEKASELKVRRAAR
jgi:hypothetical protein